MRRGRLRRSGLMPLVVIVLLAVGGLGGVLAAGWGPKLGLDLEGGFSVVLQPVETATEESLDQAIEIIRSRVDALGVAEPEITRQGSTIEVSLPGVTDRERARELVGQTAELRFRPVLSNPLPGSIEDLLSSTTTTEEGATTTTGATTDSTTSTTGDVQGQSATGAAVPFQDGSTSTTAATTTTAPGETTTTAPVTGYELTPREDDVADQPVVLAEYDDEGKVVYTYQLGPSVATGEIVRTAQARLSQTGEWTVALEIKGGKSISSFNTDAAAPCYSRAATCPTGQLAIVLDSRVVMAPAIQQPSYKQDQIQISGSLSESEAKDLALVLRYGSLPVALEVQQTREVSATLGSDSLRAGLISGVIGLVLVTAYMLLYYRMLGLIAVGSLSVSGGLLWIVICWLGEQRGLALTLAGITGIIVSIGIAVDSNVVFYENLKEDVSRGRSVRHAVSGSFTDAFRTIVMADVASLIGAGVLYFLTVGSVRGFALFLGLSTLLDILSSYFFMRPLVVWMARNPRFNEHPRRLGLASGEVPA